MTDNRVSTFHVFDVYNIPKDDLMLCFYMIDPLYACYINQEQNIIEWWGKITRIDETPWLLFTQCDIPSVEEVNEVYPRYLETKQNKRSSRSIATTHQDQCITELNEKVNSLLRSVDALTERLRELEILNANN